MHMTLDYLSHEEINISFIWYMPIQWLFYCNYCMVADRITLIPQYWYGLQCIVDNWHIVSISICWARCWYTHHHSLTPNVPYYIYTLITITRSALNTDVSTDPNLDLMISLLSAWSMSMNDYRFNSLPIGLGASCRIGSLGTPYNWQLSPFLKISIVSCRKWCCFINLEFFFCCK